MGVLHTFEVDNKSAVGFGNVFQTAFEEFREIKLR